MEQVALPLQKGIVPIYDILYKYNTYIHGILIGLQPSLLVHQRPDRKDKRTGRCPNENIRTPHGKGHPQVAGPHIQKEMPAKVGDIDENVSRKDLALAQDVSDPPERVGRARHRCRNHRSIVPDHVCCCFDVLFVFLVAGIVQSVSRGVHTVVAGGRRFTSHRFTDFVDDINGGADVKDSEDCIREQPGIAEIKVVVGIPMEIEFRSNSTKDRNGVRGNRDRVVENEGRLQSTSISVVGIINFIR
jgi:hypothetical protein